MLTPSKYNDDAGNRFRRQGQCSGSEAAENQCLGFDSKLIDNHPGWQILYFRTKNAS